MSSPFKDALSSLVYSTDQGDLRAADAQQERQAAEEARLASLDGIVRIRRETSGRKGKGVTTITGIPLMDDELKALSVRLKKRCGSGGTLKDGIIEIQGDHRETARHYLQQEGFTVKLAGG